MIRDPSDGSVREPKPRSAGAMPVSEPGMTGISPAISGLPAGSTKPEQIERLNKSREWLKDYHAHRNTEGAKE